MPYYEKTIISGPMMEVERYFATRDGRKLTRGCVEAESTDEQNDLNEAQSWRRLWRLTRTNFDGKKGDLFMTYTDSEAMTEAEAMRGRGKLLNELRKARKREGLEPLKYIIITEKQGKWHHHIIMNGGLTLNALRGAWGNRGRVHLSVLDDIDNYKGLMKYLTQQKKSPKGKPDMPNIKQPRRKYARRWSASRNLDAPVVKKRPIKPVRLQDMPKAPKGYRLLPEWVKGSDRYGNYYLYFTCMNVEEARPKARRCSTPQGRGLGRSPNGVRGSAPLSGHERSGNDEKGEL